MRTSRSAAAGRSFAAVAALVGLLATSQTGDARSIRRPAVDADTEEAEPNPMQEPELGVFGSRFSLERVAALLDESPSARLRALERLSAIGSAPALLAMERWLERSTPTEDEWLAVCRALAPHAGHARARKWLMRISNGAFEVHGPHHTDLARLTRATAAMALARSQHPRAVAALGRAVNLGALPAELARDALLAHPPAALSALLPATGVASVELIDVLERLGDQRAFHPLRRFVREGTPAIQARAALALFRLGHLETVELAEHWAVHAPAQPELIAAAAEITVSTGSKHAARAFAALLARDPDAALTLAARVPRALMVEPLLTRFEERHAELARLLGVVGGELALSTLEAWLTRPKTAEHAAFALAKSEDAGAQRILEQAAARAPTEAIAVRALVLRAWWHAAVDENLLERLQELAKDEQLTRRHVGVWGLCLLGDAGSLYATSKRWEEVAALGATMLVQPASISELAATQLSEAEQPRLALALAASLVHPEAARVVPSSVLHRLVDQHTGLLLLAGAALVERVEARVPMRQLQVLEARDVLVRTQALRGLGARRDAASLGQLRQGYYDATDARLRRSAVEGLAAKPKSQARDRVLGWARDFDPDALVRQLAREALAGESVARRMGGHSALWLELADHAPGSAVIVSDEHGRSIVALVPPDQRLIVVGVGDGPVSLRALGSTPMPSPSPRRTSQQGAAGN